jgi:hypothetical protein
MMFFHRKNYSLMKIFCIIEQYNCIRYINERSMLHGTGTPQYKKEIAELASQLVQLINPTHFV